MKKHILPIVLVMSLLCSGCGALTGSATGALTESAEGEQLTYASALELTASADALVTAVLEEYKNGEVFVSYADGSFEVLTFETEADLSEGLELLEADQNVVLIQPNYSYTAEALSTSDALSTQQWALSNDGSFQMEEQENRFPVYDTPFGVPSAPGQWMMPGNFGNPGGRQGFMRGTAAAWGISGNQQTTAVEGVDINAESAWELYNGGTREVVVAVIDTGIDYSHEDLADAIWINEDEISGNGLDDDGNGYVDDVYGWNFYGGNNRVYTGSEDDHGTHGAGTIAAASNNCVGVAGIVNSENVKIMSLKALGGSSGSGSTASIIQAIRYAEANGASICNLSLGSSVDDKALYRAIAESSMLFVVAAGNDSADTDTAPCYPASYDLENIISVANLNYDGTLHYSSNYGARSVDLAAPGTYILSTTPDDGYSYMTGTSMAAPMVTAAAAMIYSHYEGITLADVKEIILSTTTALDSLNGNTLTGGMLNLGDAMAYDVSSLSGSEWDSVIVDTGSAPTITLEQTTQQGQNVLVVSVSDVDGDLATVAYAAGTLDAAYFQNGYAGKSFSLDRNGQAVFTISSSGTYSFYARDSFGNETVESITVESITVEYTAPEAGWTQPVSSQRPTSPGFPSGGWNMPTGRFFHGWARGMY